MNGIHSRLVILVVTAVTAVTAGVAVGCRCGAGERGAARRGLAGAASSDASVPDAPPSVALPPLAAAAELLEVPVAGHRSAVVSVPRGATRPRPLVLVLHGGRDRPDEQCRTWRRVVGGELFVVCPRGLPREEVPASEPPFYRFVDLADTEAQLRAVLRALKVEFGAHLAAGPVVLVGVDASATLALGIARKEPAFFTYLILVEGGFDYWTPSLAARYSVRGGRKVLFACVTPPCRQHLDAAVALARHVGLDARGVTADAPGTLHEGPLAERLSVEFPWLVADEPRYQPTAVAAAAVPGAPPPSFSVSAGASPSGSAAVGAGSPAFVLPPSAAVPRAEAH